MTQKNIPAISDLSGTRFFLERPRIHGLLEKALEKSAVVINAGAGYGKTYAVSSFLRQRSETSVWVQFSELDNEPWHFWENYTHALGRCKPQAEKDLLESGFPETARQFERWRDVVYRNFSKPEKYVVVTDDFHTIKSKVVLEFVDRSLLTPIPNRTTFFIGRSEPELNIISAMAKGYLCRIDAEDLLFSLEETTALFNMWGLELRQEEIAEIHRDTEGWAMALGVLETEIQKNGGKYARHVFERETFKFLEDNIFASIPCEIQNYLVKLSLLGQWPIDLLEKTAVELPPQYRDRQALLGELGKLGAVIRYDYYLQGYHIHQIFLDYLKEKQRELSQNEMRKVCEIAGKWCLENNLKMEAALNFERAGDYAALLDIVNTFPRFVSQATAASLLDIIERLISQADKNIDDFHFIYLKWMVRGRLLMSLVRYDEARAVFEESIRYFEPLPASPETARILAEAWNCLGVIILSKRRFDTGESCLPALAKSADYYRQYPWPVQSPMLMGYLGTYLSQIGYPVAPGDFERRVRAYADNVPLMGNAVNGFIYGQDELVRTELTYYRGEIDAAEQYARRAIIKSTNRYYDIYHRGIFYLLRISLYRGSPEEFQEAWKQHEVLRSAGDYLDRDAICDIVEGWVYSQLGEPYKAAAWLRGQFEANDFIFQNYKSVVKAKCLYAEKQFAETVAFLGLPEHNDSIRSFLLGMLEMNCIEAAAWYQLGEEKAALEVLEKTWEAAASNDLDMPFIELGQDMRNLISFALESDSSISRPWLENIRSRASAYGKNLAAVAEQQRGGRAESSAKVFLTRQERTVLQGLSRGQSREEIADAAGQSLSTVKNIISRICEKLGAVNRADAVRIATNMGILN
jgi:LuxR family maltose regulon positive regulatory protein